MFEKEVRPQPVTTRESWSTKKGIFLRVSIFGGGPAKAMGERPAVRGEFNWPRFQIEQGPEVCPERI
jgi:hypothetical protein